MLFGAKIGLGCVLVMAQGMFVQKYGHGDETDIRTLCHMACGICPLGYRDGLYASFGSTNNDIDAVCSGVIRAF